MNKCRQALVDAADEHDADVIITETAPPRSCTKYFIHRCPHQNRYWIMPGGNIAAWRRLTNGLAKGDRHR